MKTIFVIGGMGSGKSTVTRRLEGHGAPIIDLDELGHEILDFPETKRALVSAFDEEILDDVGRVIRPALAAKAFASQEATAQLNTITTNRIIDRLRMLLTELSVNHSVVFVEVSAYDGPQGRFSAIADGIIAVVAPVELRVARAVAKGFEETDVRRRLGAQASDQQRCIWADAVIENDGDIENLTKQVDSLWQTLSID